MTTGVLLLHGSSGAPDLSRARMLEAAGYDVLAPKWFEGRISEIPLESFPLDELAERNDRLVVMGMSYGAVAALLLGTVDEPPSYIELYRQSLLKTAGHRMARGGSEESDRAFGGQAWADVDLVLAGTR